MKDIKELLDKTTDLPEALKEELVATFSETVQQKLQEKLNIDVNKPLELIATDPDFKRLVTAWDRNNPETTRAQLLRSFPAAFKDLQGNTIAEPLVDFLMDILHALVADTSLMQRLIRQMNQMADEKEQGAEELQQESALDSGFKFLRILTEDANDYLQKEEYVLNAGYKFAFFANDELMPVSPEEATHKVFVKTVTVSNADVEEPEDQPEENEESEETPVEEAEGDTEFSFVAKKMVALEWQPEFGGVGTEEVEKAEEPKEEEEPEEVETEVPEEDEVPVEDEDLVDKVNEYLEYVSDEFIKENKVNIESGIKLEIAENLITGLRNVLVENNLVVDDKKKDIITKLEEKIKSNEEALNSIYEKNIELFKENKKLRQQLFENKVEMVKNEIFAEENITEAAKEKIQKLFKFVTFTGNETEEEIANKIHELKESVITPIGGPTSSSNKVKALLETDKVEFIKPQPSQKEDVEETIKKYLKNLN